MTKQRHFKRRVRARMGKTGERYSTARRQVLKNAPKGETMGNPFSHFPGINPGSTALRILLANAGLADPHTGEPFTEAMVFGISGGIGAGVYSFHYEKEDFSSFFISGRHLWQDDLAYLEQASQRFRLRTAVRETGGAKAALGQLQEMIGTHGPAIAWVDLGSLPHRALPEHWVGGGYHVLVVYELDEQAGTALVGDLADDPIELSLENLAGARARIRKQKNRLLSIEEQNPDFELGEAVRSGLRACHAGLVEQRQKNFTLEAFKTWADRMHGSRGKDSWERIFKPGANLWRGLVSIYEFIEQYGTGGGLLRPLFAQFLTEAAEAISDERLLALGREYAELGAGWSELAEAALPDEVREFRMARELRAESAQVYQQRGGRSEERLSSIWRQLEELEERAGADFPLTDSQAEALRVDLKARILNLYEAELAASRALQDLLE